MAEVMGPGGCRLRRRFLGEVSELELVSELDLSTCWATAHLGAGRPDDDNDDELIRLALLEFEADPAPVLALRMLPVLPEGLLRLRPGLATPRGWTAGLDVEEEDGWKPRGRTAGAGSPLRGEACGVRCLTWPAALVVSPPRGWGTGGWGWELWRRNSLRPVVPEGKEIVFYIAMDFHSWHNTSYQHFQETHIRYILVFTFNKHI